MKTKRDAELDSKGTPSVAGGGGLWRARVALVVAAIGLVHVAPVENAAAQTSAKRPAMTDRGSAPRTKPAALPPQVVEMRDAILAAAAIGDIGELRTPFEWNELPPDIADGPASDPIAHWRAASADGQGREILAALANMLSVPPAVLPGGRDIENNRVFVWPYLAELPLATLTPAQEVDLYRLVPPAEAKAIKDKGRYTGWRLVIGADGTWISFKKDP